MQQIYVAIHHSEEKQGQVTAIYERPERAFSDEKNAAAYIAAENATLTSGTDYMYLGIIRLADR